MQQSDERVVALDLGSAKVAAVVMGEDEKDKPLILSLAFAHSEGVERSVITDLPSAADAVDRLLGKIERHMGAPVKSVWLNVAGSHLESVQSPGLHHLSPPRRPIRSQDIHAVINHSRQIPMDPDREQILSAPRGFKVDGEGWIDQPVGLSGSRLEVQTHIVTGLRRSVDDLEHAVQKGGRSLAGLVPSGLASGLAVLSPQARELGAIVIDIGKGVTTVAVFIDGGFVHHGVIKIGGDHFTSDVAYLLKTSHEEAERLKVDHGTASISDFDPTELVNVRQLETDYARPMKRKVLAEILNARAEEWVRMVAREIQLADETERTPQLVVLTGGGSLLPGLEEVLAEKLEHKTFRLGQPKVAGRFAKQVASPMLSTVVGVARYARDSGSTEIAPVAGISSWKERISTLTAWFGRR